MFDCYLCKEPAELCTQCTNNHLTVIKTETDYVCLQTKKLQIQVEERLLSRKLELINKIKAKKKQIEQKYELLRQKRNKVQEMRNKTSEWQKDIDEQVQYQFEKKSQHEKLYQDSVDFYCKKDDQGTKTKMQYKQRLLQIKRFQVLNSGRLFDLFKDYHGYTVGDQEFKIQKVNLLQHYNEFVLIERNNILKSLGEIQTIPECKIEEELYTTALEGVIENNFNVMQNYMDKGNTLNGSNNQQPQPSPWDQLRETFGFQKFLEPSEITDLNSKRSQARERSNTMEEFEKFQGDCSTDLPLNKEEKKNPKCKQQKLSEARKIKEEYASFITLTNSDYECAGSLFDSGAKQKMLEREERIQGSIHSMCLLIQGICRILSIPLPYPIKLSVNGFKIKDSAENTYPLWLKTSDSDLQLKHQIRFENAIILLDKDIQFILYLNGFELIQGSNNNQILQIVKLFRLSNNVGKDFNIMPKKSPLKKSNGENQNPNNKHDKQNSSDEEDQEYDLDQFEVLKLQNRQKSANQQLEDQRQSSCPGGNSSSNRKLSNGSDIQQQQQPSLDRPKSNDSDWSDLVHDEEDVELIRKIKTINLQDLINEGYNLNNLGMGGNTGINNDGMSSLVNEKQSYISSKIAN